MELDDVRHWIQKRREKLLYPDHDLEDDIDPTYDEGVPIRCGIFMAGSLEDMLLASPIPLENACAEAMQGIRLTLRIIDDLG